MAGFASLMAVTITSFLVIVLARAAWHKLDRFLETVGFAQDYGLVPAAWAAPIIRVLTGLEALTIVALVLPGFRLAGAVLAAGLFAGYGGLMAAALMKGKRRIDCGCGGPPQMVSGFTLGRNALLAALALVLAGLPVVSVQPHEALVAIIGALVLAAVYGIAEKLASHLPHIEQGEH